MVPVRLQAFLQLLEAETRLEAAQAGSRGGEEEGVFWGRMGGPLVIWQKHGVRLGKGGLSETDTFCLCPCEV